MPITASTVAIKCTITVLRSNFSRPKLGHKIVNTTPSKNTDIGIKVLVIAEAIAIAGAMIRAV